MAGNRTCNGDRNSVGIANGIGCFPTWAVRGGGFRGGSDIAPGLSACTCTGLPGECYRARFLRLKDTKTVALLGSIESVAYVIYTAILARYMGAIGVVLGYVLLFNGSFLWQVIILRIKTGKVSGNVVLNSFMRTGLAALVGAAAAWGVTRFTSNIWVQLIFGGAFGLLTYVVGLWILKSPEINQALDMFRNRGKTEPPIHPIVIG